MVTGKIKEIIANYRKQGSIWSSDFSEPTPLKINSETMNNIAQFLKEKHTPLPAKQKITLPTPAPINEGVHCRKCGSDNISIRYGRFGYYFECKKCSETMSIKEHCPKCGQQSKLRKDGNQFYIECKKCDTSTPFFKNVS